MELTIKEKNIVKKFKKRIDDKFPGDIINVLIFGSKARGDATKKSDIDIAVITSSDNWKRGDEIREMGYEMDESIDYKLSIQIIPKCHLDYLTRNKFQFIENIERDAISV